MHWLFFPRTLDFEESSQEPDPFIDTPLPSPSTASGLQHADIPLLALEWGERCLSLGLVPWPVHLMHSPEISLLPCDVPPFVPNCDIEPCAQWYWPPMDKNCDNLSSAWSTCADSAECDAASVPGTPSMASRLRCHEMSQSQASTASSSDGFTPRSAQGADVSFTEMTASQQHLMNLRASGQATLKVLATESTTSVPCHINQHRESDWSGLEQWCNENNVACRHVDVSDLQSWRRCGEIMQDAFTVHSGLQTSLQWD